MSGLYINEDGWMFYANRSVPPWNNPITLPMNEDGLRQQMEYYTVPGVTGIIFNGNGMRAFFDSNTFEPIWAGMEEKEDGRFYFRGKPLEGAGEGPEDLITLCCNAKKLFENVKDPYRYRYDYCRARGIEMWISMRMNDVHYADNPERIMHARLWREQPELRRAHYREKYTFWFSQCYDYGQEEVRRHHMNLVREYLERFEMDGFELDWMRNPWLFKPGFAESGRAILTEFTREVKNHVDAAAKRWGHPIKINVRVPVRPEDALQTGLDVFSWAEEGLIDMVTPSPYFQSTSSTMPVNIWRRLLPDRVTLAPCLEQHVSGGSGFGRMRTTAEADTGFANTCFGQGADAIYLFNHMFRDGCADLDKQRAAYSWLGNPEETAGRARRHIVTPHEGIPEGSTGQNAFCSELPPGRCISVRVNAGPGNNNRRGHVLLGFDREVPLGQLEVRLNTVPCSGSPDFALPEFPENMTGVAFAIPPGTLHNGENMIEVRNLSDGQLLLQWAEIAIN